MARIKFIIADDHKIFRKGVLLFLSNNPKLHCIGEAGDGIELLKLIKLKTPDVILLDIRMPNMDGIQALKELKSKYPSIKVLILTMYDDEHFILHLMEMGANGYLLKNTEPEAIQEAIQNVYECEYHFNEMVSAALLNKLVVKGKITPKFKDEVLLNINEKKVLQLICKERTAAEIALELNLSQRTVEGIKSILLEKTGARNIAGLVLFAVKNEIFEV